MWERDPASERECVRGREFERECVCVCQTERGCGRTAPHCPPVGGLQARRERAVLPQPLSLCLTHPLTTIVGTRERHFGTTESRKTRETLIRTRERHFGGNTRERWNPMIVDLQNIRDQDQQDSQQIVSRSVNPLFRVDDRPLGGVPREQKMLKGHLPRVRYHQVY